MRVKLIWITIMRKVVWLTNFPTFSVVRVTDPLTYFYREAPSGGRGSPTVLCGGGCLMPHADSLLSVSEVEATRRG